MEERKLLLGDEAVALGALHAGIAGVYAYPGTPSTEITEYIRHSPLARARKLHDSWSANEKTAMEAALGVSHIGKRALVCMKHVGMNVCADAFVNSAITGVNGGLVVVAADDPSMHSSQNEQDSRFYGQFALVPVFEPSSQQEAYDMMEAAFALSERERVPVLMRLTTRMAHSRAVVRVKERFSEVCVTGRPSLPSDWVLLPGIARRKYAELVAAQETFLRLSEASPFNGFFPPGAVGGSGQADGSDSGLTADGPHSGISAGHSDFDSGFSLSGNADGCSDSGLSEGGSGFDSGLSPSGNVADCSGSVQGSSTTGPGAGLSADGSASGLSTVGPDSGISADHSDLNSGLSPSGNAAGRFPLGVVACGIAYNYVMENYPDGCPFPLLKISQYPLPAAELTALAACCEELLVVEEGQPFVEERLKGLLPASCVIRGRLSGDLPRTGELNPDKVAAALGLQTARSGVISENVVPRPPALCEGCGHRSVYAALNRVLESYPEAKVFGDIGCYTLGALPPYRVLNSCVDMGASITMAKGAADAGLFPSIAVIGDSTFTHSGMTGLLDAVNDRSNLTIVISDNLTTAMTGGQPSSGTGRIEAICLGIGVEPEHVRTVLPVPQNMEEITRILREEIDYEGVSVIVPRRECLQTLRRKAEIRKAGEGGAECHGPECAGTECRKAREDGTECCGPECRGAERPVSECDGTERRNTGKGGAECHGLECRGAERPVSKCDGTERRKAGEDGAECCGSECVGTERRSAGKGGAECHGPECKEAEPHRPECAGTDCRKAVKSEEI